uniref:Uncharacterized protein n=1 Tax=Parascaris univalens TaxID=6257 RepID=A0A915BFZ3_PARUN
MKERITDHFTAARTSAEKSYHENLVARYASRAHRGQTSECGITFLQMCSMKTKSKMVEVLLIEQSESTNEGKEKMSLNVCYFDMPNAASESQLLPKYDINA